MLSAMLIGFVGAIIIILLVVAVSGNIDGKQSKEDTSHQKSASVTPPKTHTTAKVQTEWRPDPNKSLKEIGEELGDWLAGGDNPALEKSYRSWKKGGSLQPSMTPEEKQKLAKIQTVLQRKPPEFNLDTVDILLNERCSHFGPPTLPDNFVDDYNRAVFETIYSVFAKGQTLEKQKAPRLALNYYLLLLLNVVPLGDAYYLRPAILLERFKYYKAALAVCKLRKIYLHRENNYIERIVEWEKREARLKNKLDTCKK